MTSIDAFAVRRGLGWPSGWQRLVGGLLLAAAVVSAGCASDEQSPAEDPAVPVAEGAPLPTVVEEIEKAPVDEQVAAEGMLADAMADGVVTAEELEAFALESLQCTERAGFEASLKTFNPESRSYSFSVRNANQDGPSEPGEEDPAVTAHASCQAAYFYPAYDAFDRTNPRSEEDFRLDQERREQAVVECMSDAGFEIETFDDFIAIEDVPSDVRLACSQAYNS